MAPAEQALLACQGNHRLPLQQSKALTKHLNVWENTGLSLFKGASMTVGLTDSYHTFSFYVG